MITTLNKQLINDWFKGYPTIIERINDIIDNSDDNEFDALPTMDSFQLFKQFLDNGYINPCDYSVGLTVDGNVEIQELANDLTYIYIKFLPNSIFYNLVIKNNHTDYNDCLFDIVNNGSFNDFYKDYQALCLILSRIGSK